jgi:hypothetical protein
MSVISTWTALSRSRMEALSAASDTALFSMAGGKWLLALVNCCWMGRSGSSTACCCARRDSKLTAPIIEGGEGCRQLIMGLVSSVAGTCNTV